MLGSELWENLCLTSLRVICGYCYNGDNLSVQQSQSQIAPGELQGVAGGGGGHMIDGIYLRLHQSV